MLWIIGAVWFVVMVPAVTRILMHMAERFL